MTLLRLYFFGTLELASGEIQLPKPPTLKSQSLLAYLVVHRHRPQPRERLVGLFWGERPERKARRSLSTALWHIRRCLPDESLLVGDTQMVQFEPRADLWLDTEAFTRGAGSDDLTVLQETADLYRAAFLDGFHDDWIINERYRLEALFADVLARLMLGQEKVDEPRAAQTTALRLLSYDPLHEGAHRLVMRSYCRLGQRNAALAQYERCSEIVLRELGTTPMEETTELYEAIVDGRFTVAAAGPATATVSPRAGSARSPLDAAAHVRLVGRQAELALLTEHWEQARASQGCLMLVSGEAGVGKTRLVDAFAQRLRWQGVRVLKGRCFEFERALPYQPLTDALERALPELSDSELEALPAWVVDELMRLVPSLQERTVARVRKDESQGATPEETSLELTLAAEQDEAQVRLFGALARLLAALSCPAPLLLVLEDLHWASASTLQLVHYLARYAATLPVLVVGTWRPEALRTTHPLRALQRQLVREKLASSLPLSRLSPAAVTTMVTEMSAAGDAVLPLARRLYRETDGNPFFLIEIVKALFETDVISVALGQWQGDFGAISEGTLPLPASVSEAIEARVARLDEEARDALRVASVIGREFNFDLFNVVWGRDEEATLQALDALLRRRLIAEGVDASTSDFIFTHHLIREAVYAALPRPRRLYWHARVGEGIERLYGDALPAHVGELAYHFAQAARLDRSLGSKAVAYLRQAGEQAERQSAHREAIAYLQRGLALLQRLPPTRQRMQQELALQISLATPVTAVEGYAAPETKRIYNRARELCRELGEAPGLFTALVGLSRYYGVSGDAQTGKELAEQLLAIAESRGEPALLLEAYRNLSGCLFSAGCLPEARRLWKRAMVLYDDRQHEQHAYRFGHDPATTCLGYLSISSWMLGRPEEAVRQGDQLRQLLASMTHPSSRAYGYCLLATRACLARNLDAASEYTEQAVRLGERHRLPPWTALATALHGWVLVARDQKPVGLVRLQKGIASWRAKGFEHLTSLLLTLETEACLRLQALEEADAASAAALAIGRAGIDLFWMPEACRLRGELLQVRGGDDDAVEGCYNQALAMARRNELRMLELRAAASLARLWRDQGRGEQGRRLLSEVYDRFDEGLDTPDLRAASDLLQALSRAAIEA